jgi:hypothetical protein
LEFHAISAAAGDGVRDLVRSIADALDKIPKAVPDSTLDLPTPANENAGPPAQDTSPAPFKNL